MPRIKSLLPAVEDHAGVIEPLEPDEFVGCFKSEGNGLICNVMTNNEKGRVIRVVGHRLNGNYDNAGCDGCITRIGKSVTEFTTKRGEELFCGTAKDGGKQYLTCVRE